MTLSPTYPVRSPLHRTGRQTASRLSLPMALLTIALSMPCLATGGEPIATPFWPADGGSAPQIDTRMHPGGDYEEVLEVFRAGRRDEALYRMYVAELRYRIFLSARPELRDSQEAALLGALRQVVGQPIYAYAMAYPKQYLAIVDAVLRWHNANDDLATPKADFPQAHAEQHALLAGMRDQLLEEAGEMSDATASDEAVDGNSDTLNDAD